MRSLFYKYLSIFSLTFSISMQCIAGTPIVYKDAYQPEKNLNIAALPQQISTVISHFQQKKSDLYKVVVYQFRDYYVLYFLSSKYWQILKVRVDLNTAGTIVNIIDPYQGTSTEAHILSSSRPNLGNFVCPDPSVEYVAMSAVPEVGDVSKAIDAVYQSASKKYKTIKIVGNAANYKNYISWMSCPNLKGFYSIGHGSNMEIMVANEDIIPYSIFHDVRFSELYYKNKTKLVFNSCYVFNEPFGTEFAFGNAYTSSEYDHNPGPLPGFFMGGRTPLLIRQSEDVSACFITRTLSGATMDYSTLRECTGDRDFNYRNFGLSFPLHEYGSEKGI